MDHIKQSSIKYSLIIINIYSIIFLLSEISYRYIFNIPEIGLGRIPENYLLILLFVGLYYFAKYKFTRIFILFFFFLTTVVNNLHYSVYLSWINGLHYLLAFTEHREASKVAVTILDKLAIPAIWGVVECIIFFSISFFRRKSYAFSDFLFLALIAYISIRSFNTGQQHGISPKTDYSRIKANYFSFGYFFRAYLTLSFFLI